MADQGICIMTTPKSTWELLSISNPTTYFMLVYQETDLNESEPVSLVAVLKFSMGSHQGRIYSFGEEGMQLVQPSKFFSVTIFRTCSIGSIGTCAHVNWGYVAIFSNTEKFRCLYRLHTEGEVAQ